MRVSSLSLLKLLVLSMITGQANSALCEVKRVDWGVVGDEPVYLYTLTNANGMVLEMTNFGAKITSLLVPDKAGSLDDVVLGFDSLKEYQAPNPSFGATIGRFTNRIRDGRFVIDGKTYQLETNEGSNTLHGAGEFEYVVWDSEVIDTERGHAIRFSFLSADGSHGFPGNLSATVTYTLTDDNSVHVSYEAETDKATHVNFTQHSYFNLNGMKSPVFEHVVRINADTYQVMDGVLATGEVDSLEGKSWDLGEPTRLGDNMKRIPLGGYHHTYIVTKLVDELAFVARVSDPESGRTLTVSSTQPAITFYAAMGLTDNPVGKNGTVYGPYSAFCLETQHHTDAPNHPQFPSTLLRPGERYHEIAVYDFGVIGQTPEKQSPMNPDKG